MTVSIQLPETQVLLIPVQDTTTNQLVLYMVQLSDGLMTVSYEYT